MALTQVKTSGIADDAVTQDKVANDAIDITELKGRTDGHILTYDASGNPTSVGPGTDGQVLTSTGAGSPPAFETLPASNNYTHPNHSGGVTSTADGAQVIADDVVDEANLKISNAGSNGQFLSKQSGNTGGLTWATISSTPEGEAILSTTNSNEASTKFLRADGDGTCSWQVPPAATSTSGTDNFTVADGNLVIGTSGHGIDFSATSDYTNKDDEVLADYETGYFTPTTINSITLVSTENRLWYVKVGHQVTISGSLQVDDGQSSAKLQLSGLPFSHGTIGGNGTQVSNSAFLAWGWDTQPTYSSDDKAFWVTITGTSMNLHVRTSNGDWHYFYPSDTTWLLFNFSYYTDS